MSSVCQYFCMDSNARLVTAPTSTPESSPRQKITYSGKLYFGHKKTLSSIEYLILGSISESKLSAKPMIICIVKFGSKQLIYSRLDDCVVMPSATSIVAL